MRCEPHSMLISVVQLAQESRFTDKPGPLTEDELSPYRAQVAGIAMACMYMYIFYILAVGFQLHMHHSFISGTHTDSYRCVAVADTSPGGGEPCVRRPCQRPGPFCGRPGGRRVPRAWQPRHEPDRGHSRKGDAGCPDQVNFWV